MTIAVAGAGAFGKALAVTFARHHERVVLYGRDPAFLSIASLNIPSLIRTTDIADVRDAEAVLLAVPAQSLTGFLQSHAHVLNGRQLVACCKGVDLNTQVGPIGMIRSAFPESSPAILTGPSFAADLMRGLPTALTLACADERIGKELQEMLSTPSLRLYRTTDTVGAELGGALKNVIAIACGVVIGAGLGESARAALMTRGFAEMQRIATHFGAEPQTLAGLSGLGDLALTCMSPLSRNFSHGLQIGAGQPGAPGKTVEGIATAAALARSASTRDLELPVCLAVAGLTQGTLTVADALQTLLGRPLRVE